MRLPETTLDALAMLRTEVRNASPFIEGTFRHTRRALVKNAVAHLKPSAEIYEAVAGITTVLDRMQTAMDQGANFEAAQADARSAVERFAAALEGAELTEEAIFLGL